MKKTILSLLALVSIIGGVCVAGQTFVAADGNTYQGYFTGHKFFIEEGNKPAERFLSFAMVTDKETIIKEEVEEKCVTDLSIREQLQNWLLKSEYSCVDTSEMVRLAGLLQRKEYIKNRIQDEKKTQREVQFMNEIMWKTKTVYRIINTFRLPVTGVDIY